MTQVIFAALVIFAISVALKYLVVENSELAVICQSEAPLWWCPIRETLIRTFYLRIPAVASLVLGLLAIVLGGRPLARPLAITAILLAASSLVLWGADYAAPGLLLGLLRLLRA